MHAIGNSDSVRHAKRAFGKLLLLAAATLAFGVTTAQAQTTPLRVAFVPVATWLPAWVAKDKGIFEKNGLDVTLSPIQNLSTLPPTLGKQFDIGASTAPDLLKAAASGLDVVAVAGEAVETASNQNVFLIVKKDSDIKSIKDLKGKVVATPTIGAVINVAFLHWLKANGVEPGSVRAVEVAFPNMGDQLKAGRVDAVQLMNPFAGQLLAAGNVSLGNPLLSVGDPVIFPFWIAQGEWARANPSVIGKFVASLTEAKTFIEKNDAEARAIMAKYTRLPPNVANAISLPAYDFSIKPAQLDVWAKVLRDLGQLSGNVDANRMVVTSK
jgi:NitT/TauT family transport system substrate-binding protein